jgi:glutamate synthase (NADPH/NADH) small chain
MTNDESRRPAKKPGRFRKPAQAGVVASIADKSGNPHAISVGELAKLGVPDVAMVYRRTAAEMSGYAHEMAAARQEGVRLVERAQPAAVVRGADGGLTGLRVATPEGERELAADLVVLAIGQSKLRSLASSFPGVELDKRGCVVVDPRTKRTGHAKVYAGGDCVNGGKEVVNAVADGRDAARAMTAGWAEV